VVDAGAGAGDADAFVGLNALALAFLDLHVDAQGVAGTEVRDRADGQQTGRFFLLELSDDVDRHDHFSLGLPVFGPPFAC